MATSVLPQARPLSERWFFTGMAVAMATAAFVGFAPTYYLSGWTGAPALAPSVHLHGAACTAWVLLLVLQTGLIAAGRWDIHRLTGIAGLGIPALILVSGFYVATHSVRRVHSAATAGTLADPYVFLIFPLAAVGLFAFFVVLGVANRRRPDAHKRLMLLATMSLLGPALARIVTRTTLAVPGAIGALVLIDIFLAALVAYDLATRGRLHPVTLWAGGFLLVSEPLRVAIGFSAPWQAFAQMLMA